jgi:hypothetical protein
MSPDYLLRPRSWRNHRLSVRFPVMLDYCASPEKKQKRERD